MIDKARDQRLQAQVHELLSVFHAERLRKLDEINLSTICRRNTYLLQAQSFRNDCNLISAVLREFMSAWSENTFETLFFAPIVQAEGAEPHHAPPQSRGPGRETAATHDVGFAYCYGRATGTRQSQEFERLAHHALWDERPDDSDFYIRVAQAMRALPEQHKSFYDKAFGLVKAQINADFGVNFLHSDGTIHWNRLLAYNSGKDLRIRLLRAVVDRATDTIILEEIPEHGSQFSAGAATDANNRVSLIEISEPDDMDDV